MMKNLIVFVMILAITGSAYGTVDSTEVARNYETYSTLSDAFSTAVADRNFQKARVILEKILPMMKDDLKESKKTLHQIAKAENSPVSEKEYAESYERKLEIYDVVKHYKEVSSASLRVKATLIDSSINEYQMLMKKDLSLVAIN